MVCDNSLGLHRRARGAMALLIGVMLALSGMLVSEAAGQTFPKPKPFAKNAEQRKAQSNRPRKASPGAKTTKSTPGGARPKSAAPAVPVPAAAPAGKAPEPAAGKGLEPASSPPAKTPAAASDGHAANASGDVPAMRVEIPADAWNDATRAAMFSPGRLIELDEYPALGARLRPSGEPSAAQAPASPAPAATDSAPGAAGGVTETPLPRPKSGAPEVSTLPEPPPGIEADGDCADLKSAGVIGDLLKPIDPTPAGCGIPNPVNVTAIETSAGIVALKPASTMRCASARAIAQWVKDDVAPMAKEKLGSEIKVLQTASSYVCRPRNHVSGAQLSEHGRGTALDVAGFEFDGGKTIVVGGKDDDKGFVQAVRAAACKHLTTVLGPGTDAEHGNHLHVDLKIRRGGYRICQ